jgi:hypothetical protein
MVISAQMGEQDAAHRAQQESLRQELRKADADLREELRQIAQRLTDDKTDRSTLGELLSSRMIWSFSGASWRRRKGRASRYWGLSLSRWMRAPVTGMR